MPHRHLRPRAGLGVAHLSLGIALTAVAMLVGPELGLRQAESARAAVPVRIELPDRRTATSQTFRNADGTFTTALSSGPVHFKNAQGKWAAIDSRLIPTLDAGYAWQNAANRFRVRFKAALPDEHLRLDV